MHTVLHVHAWCMEPGLMRLGVTPGVTPMHLTDMGTRGGQLS